MSEISQIKKIGILSTVFTLGAVLVILSSTLYHNWLPLTVLLMFVLAPIPNSLCGASRSDDFMSDSLDSVVDFGRFLTSILLVSGVALPVIYAHNGLITHPALYMSLAGGSLIYGTIVTFATVFYVSEEY